MTDFLSWWADHWPLIPALILIFLRPSWRHDHDEDANGLYCDMRFGLGEWLHISRKREFDKRRREP